MNAILEPNTLACLAADCPDAAGVYRLYRGPRLLHIGMAAGAATLRSEVLAHARGDYGARTQSADRVEWEVARDAVFAYQRFHALHNALSYAAHALEPLADAVVSASGRYSERGV